MAEPSPPTLREALRFWVWLGFVSFGGPSAQIAILHAEVVERRRWIDEQRFLHALNFCMLLPGPEAQQLATYIGWLLHGVRGGLVAGVLFVLPSIFVLLGLSWVYAAHGDVAWVSAAFDGVKPVVFALVLAAVWRIGRRTLRDAPSWSIAVLALVAFRGFDAPFPAVVASAGLVGWLGGVLAPRWFHADAVRSEGASSPAPPVGVRSSAPRASVGRALRVLAVCLALWWAPVLVAGVARGWDDVLVTQGVFFSKTAMVTFGGAYAVLPYVAHHAVESFGWLRAHEMLDGLGLAESTPGPLIMVVQFVGFLGGWRSPGSFAPWQSGVLSALMTTWVTFAPCFLWVFLGAPFVERLRGVRWLSVALRAITSAVVGVMLNLAVWFGLEALAPVADSGRRELDVLASVVAGLALAVLVRWPKSTLGLLLGGVLAGIVWR